MYLAVLIIHIFAFLNFVALSLPWYFHSLLVHRRQCKIFGWISIAVHLALAFNTITIALNTYTPKHAAYYDVNHSYEYGRCTSAALHLMPGYLLRLDNGKVIKLVWVAWCMVFVYGFLPLMFRVYWINSRGQAALARLEAQKQAKGTLTTLSTQTPRMFRDRMLQFVQRRQKEIPAKHQKINEVVYEFIPLGVGVSRSTTRSGTSATTSFQTTTPLLH